MEIRLEVAKCEGYGMCAEHLPELFTLDEWGYASLQGDGQVPPGSEAGAQRAIADCPVHAISEVPASA